MFELAAHNISLARHEIRHSSVADFVVFLSIIIVLGGVFAWGSHSKSLLFSLDEVSAPTFCAFSQSAAHDETQIL
eukprot:SAG11_NODE_8255_length_1039_cov_1.015957_1_plen_75_part_00